MTLAPSDQQLVVPSIHVPHVRTDREVDRVALESLRGRRSPNSARVLRARMLGDRDRLGVRTRRVQLTGAPSEVRTVLHVDGGLALRAAFPCASSRVRVGQTLDLRPRKRLLLHEDALPFVALTRTTEADDDRTQPRVSARATCERRVAAREVGEMRQIGARQAERTLTLEPQHASAVELLAAFGAGGLANQLEHDNVVAAHSTDPVEDLRNFITSSDVSR